jgi:hypothetical protein
LLIALLIVLYALKWKYEQLYGAYGSAVVLRMTVFDTGPQASSSQRFGGTSRLKAETRIHKGISPSNRDWRPLVITCCKHDKQQVWLQEMKTFECPVYYSWLTNYTSNGSHYGEKTEKPTSFVKSPNLDIYSQYFFGRKWKRQEGNRLTFCKYKNDIH